MPRVSSLTPVTTIFPLVTVLVVTAIKDAVEDYVISFLLLIWSLHVDSRQLLTRDIRKLFWATMFHFAYLLRILKPLLTLPLNDIISQFMA